MVSPYARHGLEAVIYLCFRTARGVIWLFTEAVLFLVDNLPGADPFKTRFKSETQKVMRSINDWQISPCNPGSGGCCGCLTSCGCFRCALPHGVKMEPGLKDRQLKDTLEDTEQFEEMMKKETKSESWLHKFYRAERWLHQSLLLLLSTAVLTWTIMV